MASPKTSSSPSRAASVSPSFVYLLLVMRLFFVLLGITMFLLNAWFLYYMDRMERDGCKCAQGWKRSFMQFSLIAFLSMAVVSLFINVSGHWLGVSVLFQALTIAYVIVTRSFISDVKSDHCQCAETKAFRVLDLVNMIQLVLLGIALAAAVILTVRMSMASGTRH